MSERFNRLFSLQKNLYTEEAPILVSAGALLKDTENGHIYAQLKFKSIEKKIIKFCKVEIICFDAIGRALDKSISYTYLD